MSAKPYPKSRIGITVTFRYRIFKIMLRKHKNLIKLWVIAQLLRLCYKLDGDFMRQVTGKDWTHTQRARWWSRAGTRDYARITMKRLRKAHDTEFTNSKQN